ncbi:efflux RND transporter periplasmic adaptor subunit [Pseudidiomarina sp. 1APP75-27a]|uniref:efflux RND transporter periplasmic adaptor subunit n=1 Tax=Pseudidiomarina terrestris TaxID=2820060 RepID=UPI002B0596CB|nr:efflux RND transporter periplasmic adaptor subunit [Pseudidiomarina sp. 1APP75-27a]MEA3588433.1 efflux RND transporter periplasmic adaptor subunit [Pseudidiomarina sp. 1APP75-27a]
MKKLIVFILIIAGVSFIAMSKNATSPTESVIFDAYIVQEQSITDSILASGNFTFASQITVRSEVMGKVIRLHVEEGEMVYKGDVLIELDKTAFISDVEQAEASVNIQSAEIRRLQELKEESTRKRIQVEALSEQEFTNKDSLTKSYSDERLADINLDAALHRLTQLKAVLAQRKDALSKTIFVAPRDTLAVSVDVKEGETVIAGTTNIVGTSLLTLAEIQTYVAQIWVDEADLTNISIGQRVDVFPAALPTQPLNGKITSISAMAKQKNSNQGLFYEVQVKLDSSDYLFPGMSCRAEILLNHRDRALSVPIAAIQNENGEPFVWVANNNKVEKRSVRLGLSSDIQQVIIAGLKEKEVVLTGPSRSLNKLQHGVDVKLQGG